MTNIDTETHITRIERLIGTDETKGIRGDLARARASKALGHTTWVDGQPIDTAIATYERTLAIFRSRLDALDGQRLQRIPTIKAGEAATAHIHTAATKRETHNAIRDGYDRIVETCSCGAHRTLTRECGAKFADVTEWAHRESVLAG